MQRTINLGDEKTSKDYLELLRTKRYVPFDIRIVNSHITLLNEVIGKKIFKRDALYINSDTLWEIMQPLGGRGKHHFHNLSPTNIYDALHSIKDSKEVIVSYDNRYVIVTLSTFNESTNIAVVVTTNALLNSGKTKVLKIITLYPQDKK